MNRLPQHFWAKPVTERQVKRKARTDLKFVETMLIIGFGETTQELNALARIQQRAAAVLLACGGDA